jgi:SP family arabinose:H+ symporter-like MFS transporter
MNQNSNNYILTISIVAALGGLLFGFDTAIISGTIPYISPYFNLDASSLGWAVGCILIGCAAGALLAGKCADQFGRKATLIICAILFAVSGLGAGLATELGVFVLFRLIGGLGVGAAAMVSPMYIAETVPSKQRGRLVSLYQLAIVLGILLAYLSNYLFQSTGINNWRWMFASQTIPAVLFLAALYFVPETPRWLVSKGKLNQAMQVLLKTGNDHAGAGQEITTILSSFDKAAESSIMELLSSAYRPVLGIGILVAVFQQITGINAILYYAPVIFKETGLDNASSLLQTIGIGLVNVAATFIAIKWVDKVGRKKFLVAGSILMGIALVAIAACFHFQYYDNYLVLIFMILYVGAFGCTLGAVTWVYLSEIFPNKIRSLALSLATLCLWLADFVVTYTFPMLVERLGTTITLLTYAGCCVLALLFFRWKLPETKDRSLEEIENLMIK